MTNQVEAGKLFIRAAAQGFPHAQNAIGCSYETGQGVAQDVVEAYKWYHLAVAQNQRDAKVNLNRLLPKLSAEQIAEGKNRASQFVPKPVLADTGDIRPKIDAK